MKRIAGLLVVFLLAGCGGGGGGGGDGGGGNTPQGSGGTPIASVSATTSITQSGAVLNGNVTPNGLDTQAWFEYGTDQGLLTYTGTPEQAIGQGLNAVPVDQSISGCTGGTTYYYRVCGRNAKGSTKSTITGFTTSSPGTAPAVTTLAATSVGATTATLNGSVTPNGLATNAWFEYGTDPSLASSISTSTQAVGSGTTSQPVNAGLTGLSTGTTYYYRVAASNVALLQESFAIDVRSGDYFRIGYSSGGGDPFAGGIITDSFTAISTYPYLVTLTGDISGCISANCSIGFQLQSNSSLTDLEWRSRDSASRR